MPLDPPGQILDDRYDVGARIGVGGMGEVRVGFDRRLRRDVAVKFLRADLAEQDEVRRRFQHEASSAARIVHPGAVTVFDSGESDGVPYLVMELLPGDTLADRLADGEPMEVDEAIRIGVDVLDVLDAAHGLGVLHRDVKPGNLLYTEDGRLKLADFGIAKTADVVDQTATGELMGTAAYMAPERLQGQAATPASDVYSVGVILYEALAGHKPFGGDTPLAVAYAMHAGDHEPIEAVRPEIDRRLAGAITRSLAREPGQRFSSARQMAAHLGADGPVAELSSAPTVRMPAAGDKTERQSQPVVPPAGGTQRFAAPDMAGDAVGDAVPERRSDARRILGVVAVAGIVVLVGTVVLVDRDSGDPTTGSTDTTTTSTPAGEPLPEGLEQSIAELERLVAG